MPPSTADTTNEPLVLRSDKDNVATLTLNRPAHFNTLSTPLMLELKAHLDAIADDKSVRVVVVTGAGKAFCAGHDLQEMRDDPSEPAMRALFNLCNENMLKIIQLPQPVIAKVQGVAAAAGCQLVAQCDLAIAANHAKFGASGINIGLFCSTPTVPITRNLGRKQAMELLLTGDLISAEKAQALGLINRAVPAEDLDQAVAELAAKIAGKSPHGIAIGKELFYTQIEEGIGAAYERAAEMISCNMQSTETQDAIDAFLDKKPLPNWSDR
ncbi:MAG: enoyl-CoA hydratase [Proteobacteria bacterium]|nr:enoyl-CoA hydratase [Pseudomonadota bacterium]